MGNVRPSYFFGVKRRALGARALSGRNRNARASSGRRLHEAQAPSVSAVVVCCRTALKPVPLAGCFHCDTLCAIIVVDFIAASPSCTYPVILALTRSTGLRHVRQYQNTFGHLAPAGGNQVVVPMLCLGPASF
jgi:hypothetical protein